MWYGNSVKGPYGSGLTGRRELMFSMLACSLLLMGCDEPKPGTPEKVADAFVVAYFGEANQEKAKQYTAFGATKRLEREIRDVQSVRAEGYTPQQAAIDVTFERGARSMREERVRFDYLIRYPASHDTAAKHADIELAEVHGEWKVVRIGLAKDEVATE